MALPKEKTLLSISFGTNAFPNVLLQTGHNCLHSRRLKLQHINTSFVFIFKFKLGWGMTSLLLSGVGDLQTPGHRPLTPQRNQRQQSFSDRYLANARRDVVWHVAAAKLAYFALRFVYHARVTPALMLEKNRRSPLVVTILINS